MENFERLERRSIVKKFMLDHMSNEFQRVNNPWDARFATVATVLSGCVFFQQDEVSGEIFSEYYKKTIDIATRVRSSLIANNGLTDDLKLQFLDELFDLTVECEELFGFRVDEFFND